MYQDNWNYAQKLDNAELQTKSDITLLCSIQLDIYHPSILTTLLDMPAERKSYDQRKVYLSRLHTVGDLSFMAMLLEYQIKIAFMTLILEVEETP